MWCAIFGLDKFLELQCSIHSMPMSKRILLLEPPKGPSSHKQRDQLNMVPIFGSHTLRQYVEIVWPQFCDTRSCGGQLSRIYSRPKSACQILTCKIEVQVEGASRRCILTLNNQIVSVAR